MYQRYEAAFLQDRPMVLRGGMREDSPIELEEFCMVDRVLQ